MGGDMSEGMGRDMGGGDHYIIDLGGGGHYSAHIVPKGGGGQYL